METTQSIEIIDRMLAESRKSLHRNSFYFIMWGSLLIPAVLLEYYLSGQHLSWIGWPLFSVIGGVVSAVYGRKEDKRSGVQTFSDRVTIYTWGAFGFVLAFSILYSIYNHLSPYPLVLMLSGMATFISGGISKFKPFVLGGMVLGIGAVICGFFISTEWHGLVFILCMIIGYIVPGVMLKKVENGQA